MRNLVLIGIWFCALAAAQSEWATVPAEMLLQTWRGANYLSERQKQGLDAATEEGLRAAMPLANALTAQRAGMVAAAEGGHDFELMRREREQERLLAGMLAAMGQPLSREMAKLGPPARKALLDEVNGYFRPAGGPMELFNRRRQLSRMAEALELNPAQRRALDTMSSQMMVQMPSLLWQVKSDAGAFAQAVIEGRALRGSADQLAKSVGGLTGRLVRVQAAFLVQLNPRQRARAKEMFAEMRETLLGGRHAA